MTLKQIITISCVVCLLALTGCEDTDVRMAAEAGIDAVTAVTLSDAAVQKLAIESAAYADQRHQIAPAGDPYAERLKKLVGENLSEDGLTFNYQVYLTGEVNAFAMANGAIRIYSGLMDMLDDGELRFVIGHEMGHVVKKHIRKQIQLAYAASAARKGIASINSMAGDLARSQLGSLVESILGAQFSQLEEKESDDYGLFFLKKTGYDPRMAVSALQKLATLGDNHSFLSSHPAPGKRAERLALQLEGKALPVEEARRNFFDRITSYLDGLFPGLYKKLRELAGSG